MQKEPELHKTIYQTVVSPDGTVLAEAADKRQKEMNMEKVASNPQNQTSKTLYITTFRCKNFT